MAHCFVLKQPELNSKFKFGLFRFWNGKFSKILATPGLNPMQYFGTWQFEMTVSFIVLSLCLLYGHNPVWWLTFFVESDLGYVSEPDESSSFDVLFSFSSLN